MRFTSKDVGCHADGTECSQETCDALATHSYVWPGHAERSYVCDDHLGQLQGVASAMGFDLGDLRREIPTCPARTQAT